MWWCEILFNFHKEQINRECSEHVYRVRLSVLDFLIRPCTQTTRRPFPCPRQIPKWMMPAVSGMNAMIMQRLQTTRNHYVQLACQTCTIHQFSQVSIVYNPIIDHDMSSIYLYIFLSAGASTWRSSRRWSDCPSSSYEGCCKPISIILNLTGHHTLQCWGNLIKFSQNRNVHL